MNIKIFYRCSFFPEDLSAPLYFLQCPRHFRARAIANIAAGYEFFFTRSWVRT